MKMKGSSNVKKLLQTLYHKKRYTVHYRTLQLYCELGLEVDRLHRVLQFQQDKWLEPYISLNSQLREASTNKFQENFFKLMNNSTYGKTCESKRNRMSVKVVRTQSEACQRIKKFTFKSFQIFTENIAAITNEKSVIYWNKPTIVGATNLELAKRQMFQFHYLTMKAIFNCHLLYSDADSLLYSIKSDDLTSDLALNHHILDQFDFSNYPQNHPLYNASIR